MGEISGVSRMSLKLVWVNPDKKPVASDAEIHKRILDSIAHLYPKDEEAERRRLIAEVIASAPKW